MRFSWMCVDGSESCSHVVLAWNGARSVGFALNLVVRLPPASASTNLVHI